MKKKIDFILWAIIWLIPVAGWLFVTFRDGGTAPGFITYVNAFAFTYVEDVINNIWETVFNGSTLALAGFISYLVSVEVIHCMFDALVFIPRFAHNLIDKFVGFAEGEKK